MRLPWSFRPKHIQVTGRNVVIHCQECRTANKLERRILEPQDLVIVCRGCEDIITAFITHKEVEKLSKEESPPNWFQGF